MINCDPRYAARRYRHANTVRGVHAWPAKEERCCCGSGFDAYCTVGLSGYHHISHVRSDNGAVLHMIRYMIVGRPERSFAVQYHDIRSVPQSFFLGGRGYTVYSRL